MCCVQGLNVPSESVDKIKVELETRLKDDVMAKLDEWLSQYREIKVCVCVCVTHSFTHSPL